MSNIENKNIELNLIKEIVLELREMPTEYLQTLYAIIHSFRTNLPEEQHKKEIKNTNEDSFDWDSLIDDINTNRQNSNIQLNQRIEKIL